MIRVLVDGRMVRGARHGIARYTLSLVEELVHHGGFELVVAAHPDEARSFLDLGAAVAPTRVAFVSVRASLELSKLERAVHPDAVFCPSFVVPLLPRAPLVMTLHDATHLQSPGDYSRAVAAYYRLVTLPAARRAASVLTVSEASSSALRRWTKLDDVQVIPNGVDSRNFHAGGPLDPRIPTGCILYAGGFKPHKRVEMLIDALALLPGVPLALAGAVPQPLRERAWSSGLGGRWLELGLVDDEVLAAAYRAATVFAYPSCSEGFGLPPLEAMACGTAVVCSALSSLPEVVGDAAMLFQGDARELAAALRSVLDDEVRRREMIQRGAARARVFTWQRAGVHLAAVLQRAAGSS
ncbi:MAG: glycosyltransferase family 1 protein [Pseudomonadota bacterium]